MCPFLITETCERLCSFPEWRWALVGNIIEEHPFGEEHKIRKGTKQFAPRAKVYCSKVLWGVGYECMAVIGKPRNSNHYIEIEIKSKMVENFRLKKVFNPAILAKMNGARYICKYYDYLVRIIVN